MEQDLNSLVRSILGRGYLMSLATVDENGPWVSDVIYVHDEEGNLFWMSQTGTRHSLAVMKNPEVAATITLTGGPAEAEESLQISGFAEKIEGDILAIAIAHRAKRGKPAPAKTGEILGQGESWYKLRPIKLRIIHSPTFGKGARDVLP